MFNTFYNLITSSITITLIITLLIPNIAIAFTFPQYSPGEMVIMFDTAQTVQLTSADNNAVKSGVAKLDELNAKHGVNSFRYALDRKVSGRGKFTKIYNNSYILFFADKDIDIEQTAAEYQALPAVSAAYPVWLKKFFTTPNDSLYSKQWYIPQTGVDKVWATTKLSEDVLVVALDSGLDWKHPDLGPVTWQNLDEDADGDGRTLEYIDGEWQFDPGDLNDEDDENNGKKDDLIGWDFIDGVAAWAYQDDTLTQDADDPDNDPMDFVYRSHGTECSGIMAAAGNNSIGIAGINWNIKVMGIRTGYYAFAPEIPAGGMGVNYPLATYPAMDYIMDKGVDVINLSWGGPTVDNVMKTLCEEAWSKGIILIGGSGNDNCSTPFYPAAYPGVMTVGGTDKDDLKAWFANYGSWVDICAPAVDILTTYVHSEGTYYGNPNGTSFSSPLVAGIAALIISAYHDSLAKLDSITARDFVYNRILESADSIDHLNPEYRGQLGTGRANAYKAICQPIHPILSFVSFSATDAPEIDGRIDPGESGEIYITFQNTSDTTWQPARNCTLIVYTSDSSIEFIQGRALLEDIHIGGEGSNEADPIIISLDSTALPSYTTFHYEIHGPHNYCLTGGQFDLLLGKPILLYDDDGGDNYEQHYIDALGSNDLVYEVHEVDSLGHLSSSEFSQYETIIWFTGDRRGDLLPETQIASLITFLEAGKDLILSGQHLTNDIGGTEFMTDYLGTEVVADSVSRAWSLTVVARENSIADYPETDTIRLLGGPATQAAISDLAPLTAKPLYYPAAAPDHYFATYYKNRTFDYRTVFLGFGFEGIHNSNIRAELIKYLIEWSTAGIPGKQVSSMERQELIQATPNPFYKNTTIAFSIPHSLRSQGAVSIFIYNLEGTTVKSLPLTYGIHSTVWDGTDNNTNLMPPGVYICALKLDDKIIANKELILIR